MHCSAWKVVQRVLRCHTLQEIYLNLSDQIGELAQRFALTSSAQFANLLLRFYCIFSCSFCSALLSLIPCYPLVCANIPRLLHEYVQTRSSNYVCNFAVIFAVRDNSSAFCEVIGIGFGSFRCHFQLTNESP
jgi:hypothetical protein